MRQEESVSQTKRTFHKRKRPQFDELFEMSAGDAITAMDTSGDDIPNQASAVSLIIGEIGLTRHSIPVTIMDPFGESVMRELACNLKVSAELGNEKRGIHVSRMGNTLAKLSLSQFESLSQYAEAVAKAMKHDQGVEKVQVDVQSTLTYLEDVGCKKSKLSLEHLDLSARAIWQGNQKVSESSGVGFTHITACPCVQKTYYHAMNAAQVGKEYDDFLMTHSQRCKTQVELENITYFPLKDLLNIIDETVVRSQNTLPREFELSNVYRAHKNPLFLEDVLRLLVANLAYAAQGITEKSAIEVSSISMESIHDFDLTGRIRCTSHELEKLKSSRQS